MLSSRLLLWHKRSQAVAHVGDEMLLCRGDAITWQAVLTVSRACAPQQPSHQPSVCYCCLNGGFLAFAVHFASLFCGHLHRLKFSWDIPVLISMALVCLEPFKGCEERLSTGCLMRDVHYCECWTHSVLRDTAHSAQCVYVFRVCVQNFGG